MKKNPLTRDDARDDADVRGEHDYVPSRPESADSTTEEVIRERQRGDYAAGADGTQRVSQPPGKGERPADAKD